MSNVTEELHCTQKDKLADMDILTRRQEQIDRHIYKLLHYVHDSLNPPHFKVVYVANHPSILAKEVSRFITYPVMSPNHPSISVKEVSRLLTTVQLRHKT